MLPCQEQATMLATVISYASEILKMQTGRNTQTNRKKDSKAEEQKERQTKMLGWQGGWLTDRQHAETSDRQTGK